MIEDAFGQGIGLAGYFYGAELGVHVGHVVVEAQVQVSEWGWRGYFVDAKALLWVGQRIRQSRTRWTILSMA
jgi:hypothetical protein